jgi:multiple sugar transport system permease protein
MLKSKDLRLSNYLFLSLAVGKLTSLPLNQGGGRLISKQRIEKMGSMKRRQALVGWLFVLPFLLAVIAFLVVPLCYAAFLSTQTDTLIGGQGFIGLTNYRDTLTDPLFLEGLKRVVIFGIIQIPVMILIALVGALTIDVLETKLSKIFRIVAFVPYAIPAVVGALMWGFLYSRSFGPFVPLLNNLGFDNVDLFQPDIFIYSVSNIITWAWTGYNMIMLYSALQGISREIYEAAIVDGASQVQIALQIKVPAIKNTIFIACIFATIGTMQLFTEPVILAGFTNAVTLGYTPNIYAFNLAFSQSQFNYSAAVSFALGLIMLIGSYGFIIRNRRKGAA